ncbi:hypothetical protein GGQ05_000848 [Salinibacter ruber]|uniref:hypothetical protein n=1 Tax=Salinibacter ruber TaxID=146919 RepID=UPI002168090F|nr:hypothetical protein [Salinibacter ruber]MCS4169404.1 hypothetical protein [Salinibacter ruber]
MTDQPIGDMTPRELLAALGNLTSSGDSEEEDGLGFVDLGNGETDFVFLNRQEFDHGHMVDENDDPVPLPGDAMAGYIEDVYYDFKEHETYGLSQKLRVVLNTEPRRIMMEAGFFTNTAKSLVANLAQVQDPGALITIEPSLPDNPDESPNVLFTEVYENGEMIQDSEWPREDEDVIDTFLNVRENVFGFEPQDVEPQLPDRSGGGGGPEGSHSGGSRTQTSAGSHSHPNRGTREKTGARSPKRGHAA